jgi:hypothetical protein
MAYRRPIAQSELVKRLSTTVDSLTGLGQFSGVVVLAKDGAPVVQVAKGFADRERSLLPRTRRGQYLG